MHDVTDDINTSSITLCHQCWVYWRVLLRCRSQKNTKKTV